MIIYSMNQLEELYNELEVFDLEMIRREHRIVIQMINKVIDGKTNKDQVTLTNFKK